MRIQTRIVRRLPKWMRVAPLDALLAVMGLFSSAATLTGVGEPGSIARVLPSWGPILWSICLLLGCGAWIIGLSSIKEVDGALILTRMPSLIFGLYLVSLAATAYGVILIVFSGWTGLVASILFLAVGGGTYLSRIDYSARFRGENR